MNEQCGDEYGRPIAHQIATSKRSVQCPVNGSPSHTDSGLTIDRAGIAVDTPTCKDPGDLLHEAGHLAIIPAVERTLISGNAGSDPGHEMAAIAWSYAALRYLGLEPEVVFHPDGYRGGSTSLIDNFGEGRGSEC